MKLLMENWRRQFLDENSFEQSFSLLLEQELNEANFESAKKWFTSFFKRGGTEEDAEEKIEKVQDLDRRNFLRGALQAAAVAGAVGVAGMPKMAMAGSGELPIELLQQLYQEIKEAYGPGGVNADRVGTQFQKVAPGATPEQAIKFYNTKIFPNILRDLQTLLLGKEPANPGSPTSPTPPKIRELENAKTTAYVATLKDPKTNTEYPITLFLNAIYPWQNEEAYRKKSNSSRIYTLRHEAAHIMPGLINKYSRGKIDLEAIALEDLRELFDIPAGAGYKTKSVAEISLEEWGIDHKELYADLMGFRTQAGGVLTMGHLQAICAKKNDSQFDDKLPLHNEIIKIFKCPPTANALNAVNRIAKAGPVKRQAATSYAEEIYINDMNVLLELWRKFNLK